MKDRRHTAAIRLEIGLRRLEREFAAQESESKLEPDVAHLVDDEPTRPVALH